MEKHLATGTVLAKYFFKEQNLISTKDKKTEKDILDKE